MEDSMQIPPKNENNSTFLRHEVEQKDHWLWGADTWILFPTLSSDLGENANPSRLHLLHLKMRGLPERRALSLLLPH